MRPRGAHDAHEPVRGRGPAVIVRRRGSAPAVQRLALRRMAAGTFLRPDPTAQILPASTSTTRMTTSSPRPLLG